MVAIFTGLGTGLERGSVASLGASGLLGSSGFGRGGENVFLNAAAGNLVISRQDEFLIGVGPDASVTRTYNSINTPDDNGDRWRQSTDRRVFGLTGTVNTAGSTITRLSADGSVSIYTWNSAGYYETSDGAGAYDRLTYNNGDWTWTDGATQITELYKATDGVWISEQRDSDGNVIHFTYLSPGKLKRVTVDGAGSFAESIEYKWGVNDADNHITEIVTKYDHDLLPATSLAERTRTTYFYDTNNRLNKVKVRVDDGAGAPTYYETNYTYTTGASSKRLASIAQTDGSSITFTYDGNRVSDFVQTAASGDTRTTHIDYFSDHTQITDPRGQITQIYFVDGQMTQIIAPPAKAGAPAQTTQFTYDTKGNVLSVVDPTGATTDYTYTAAGNIARIIDANGNKTFRYYDEHNQLIKESQKGAWPSAASAPTGDRYVYDDEHHLRYAISAEGNVTEYQYWAAGNLKGVVTYVGHAYTTPDTVPTVAQMDDWRSGVNLSEAQNIRYDYDARGNLHQSISYGATNSVGGPSSSDGLQTTEYFYDEAGQLLSRQVGSQVAETFKYDGLGRVIRSVDLAGETTIAFNDANRTTTTVKVNANYTTVSTYNRANELITWSDSANANTTGGTLSYFYDKNGRLRRQTDQTGDDRYFLYDDAGRKVADIGDGGELVEYKYDAANRIVASIRYTNLLNATDLSALDNPDTTRTIDGIRPAATASDIIQWSIYDAGGRLIETIEGDGAVTRYVYDDADRLATIGRYVNKLTAAQIAALIAAPPTALVAIVLSADDVITRIFYDDEGRIIGQLDGSGYLRQYLYDTAGQKIEDIAYANLTGASLRASGTFDQLLASITLDAAKDIATHFAYDGQGLLRYTIDALGRVSETIYWSGDVNLAVGLVRQTVSYATAYAGADFSYAAIKTAMSAPAVANNADNRKDYLVYNSKAQLVFTVSAGGALQRFEYDGAGRLKKTTEFSVALDMAAMGAASVWEANILSWLNTPANSADPRVTQHFYSERGEVLFTLDAEGYVSGRTYDSEGRVAAESRYATQLSLSQAWSLSEIKNAGKGTAVTQRFEYDPLGRLSSVYDGADVRRYFTYYGNGEKALEIEAYGQGADEKRIKYYYDQAGRLTDEVHYASEIYNAPSNLGSNVLGATGLDGGQKITSTNGQYVALLRRDGALVIYHNGEQIWSSGAEASPAENATYQLRSTGDGRLAIYRKEAGHADAAIWLSSQTAGGAQPATYIEMRNSGDLMFAKGSGPTDYQGALWDSNTAGITASAYALLVVTKSYAYDGLGRLLTATDFSGAATQYTYDKAGRVKTIRDALNGLTTFDYDAFGRGVARTDALGHASFSYFDRVGRETLAIDAEGYATQTAYTIFGEVQSVTRRYTRTMGADIGSPPTVGPHDKDAITRYAYDKLGRAKLIVDAGGYATETTYTSFGEIASVTRYVNTTTSLTSPASHTDDAITTFIYDRLSRLASTTDAVNTTESYVLDAYGSRRKTTDRVGSADPLRVVEGVYDAVGRLITETIWLGTTLVNGTETPTDTIVNRYGYDRRGNLIRKVEAWASDGVGQRVTTYEYDKLDRLARTIGETVSVAGSAIAAASDVTLIERNYYDANGNLAEHVDAAGARTLFWYDELNRLTDTLSATGTLTEHDYDAVGRLIETRIHASPMALPASAAGAPPAATGDYRTTRFRYDDLGRLEKTITPNIKTAAYAGAFAVTTQDLETIYDYDAFGNVVQTTDASGNITYAYFDKLGRKTDQIDAKNYRTNWQYDANGNVKLETRYANAGAAPTGLDNPPNLPGLSGDDRKTEFSYDKMGRRQKEIRRDVLVSNGNGAHVAQDATIVYDYDGVGRLKTKIEASGDSIAYDYDLAGRMFREMRTAYTDYNGELVAPEILYSYNDLNDVTLVRQTGSALLGLRSTYYTYDAAGRVTGITDPTGFARTYVRDAAGRVVREEYYRVRADGGGDTEAIGADYDAAGRVVAQGAMIRSNGIWNRGAGALDTTYTKYNAFGEVAARGVNSATVLPETFDYDGAGRLWRSNAGDGVWKYFMYDRVGNQTLAIVSEGMDLANQPLDWVLARWASISVIATAPVDGVTATITQHDARNQAIAVLEPQRERTATARTDLTTTRAYNAFGEIAYEINAANARTDYAYNTMGRTIKIESPSVKAVGENGKWITGYDGFTPDADSATAVTFRPIEHHYYDASGRLVGWRDANGNLTRQSLLAGSGYNGAEALVTSVTTPDNVNVRTKYDKFGAVRRVEQPMGRTTLYTRDKMNRVTVVNQPGAHGTPGVQTDERYAYDGLGQIIERWNVVLHNDTDATDFNKERTTFDAQGRIVKTVKMGGDETGAFEDIVSYAYAWDAGITTALGAYGGWVQTTTVENGRTQEEKTDVFGRVVSRKNLAGVTTTSTYDKAGRLTLLDSSGEDISYTYFNTGRLASAHAAGVSFGTQYWTETNTRDTKYGYDSIGNLTSQYSTEVGSSNRFTGEIITPEEGPNELVYEQLSWNRIVQDASAAYDALGRLIWWDEAAHDDAPSAHVSYSYDANGNVRSSTAQYQTINEYGAINGAADPVTNWYAYDPLNRVTVQKGALVNDAIALRAGSVLLGYDDAGQRASAFFVTGIYYAPYPLPYNAVPYGTYESYEYDLGGRLKLVKSGASSSDQTKRAEFVHDEMGRLELQMDYEANGSTVAYSRDVDYDSRSRVTQETVNTKRGNVIYTSVTTYDYGVHGNEFLGAAKSIATLSKENDVAKKKSVTTNAYGWGDGAVLERTDYAEYGPNPNDAQIGRTNSTDYIYQSAGGRSELRHAEIFDGRAAYDGPNWLAPRWVRYGVGLDGEVLRRDEGDIYAGGDPHEVYFRFAGKQRGYIGNNGTADTNYAASIQDRTASPGTGAFRNGGGASFYADFDQSLQPITSYYQGSQAGFYTVRSGETLQSIAASLWGDASLWYQLAEVNGLSAGSALNEGQILSIPASVVKNTHNANTFTPYDPTEALGNTSPTAPQPGRKGKKCGGLGQIIMVIIAVVVSVYTAGAASGALSALSGTMVGGASTVAGSAAVAGAAALGGGGLAVSGAAAVVAGAIGGAAGSIASQAFGVATGIQDKFSWNAVALSAIGGGIGAGGKLGVGGSGWQAAAARGIIANVATQGIAVATGLQDKFSWAGVAAAGIGAGVFNFAARNLPGAAHLDIKGQPVAASFANRIGASGASLIADAAARTLIEGSDFGDNVLAALPNVIGQTIGEAIAGGIAGRAERARFAGNAAGNELDEFMLDTYGASGTSSPPVILAEPTPEGLVARNRTSSSQLPVIEVLDDGWTVYDVPTREGFVTNGELRYNQLTTLGSARIVTDRPFDLDSGITDDGRIFLRFTSGDLDQVLYNAGARPGGQQTYSLGEMGSVTFYGREVGNVSYEFALGATNTMARSGGAIIHGARDPVGTAQRAWADTRAVVDGVVYAANLARTQEGRAQLVAGASAYVQQEWNSLRYDWDHGLMANRVGQIAPALLFRTGPRAACFVAGTLIHTRDGLKRIEAITLQDFVLSRPENDGEQGERRVVNLIRFDDKPILAVTVAAAGGRTETFKVTSEHPFWVEDDGWVAAGELKADDRVRLSNGDDACIASIIDTETTAPVFNFEVDGWHTYHVGELGVWVHNADCFRHFTRLGGEFRSWDTFDAFKAEVGEAGRGADWHHIVEQHDGNLARFGAEAIHNTENIVQIDRSVHWDINSYYARPQPFTRGLSVRDWLQTQPYEVHVRVGERALRKFGG